ncbi:hypothetical protein, partial [Treponema sp.]|uniref:hypothetical protein n=1 Tax=Treponema sp. TaxID=166 RepID=UPI00389004A9
MNSTLLFLLQSGSPLSARFNLNYFKVILILFIIFVVIASIYIVSKTISNYLNSDAYIEKKKNRPTSLKDINEISSLCNLVKEEKEILSHVCSNHPTPNIRYLARDYYALNAILKECFKEYDSTGNES